MRGDSSSAVQWVKNCKGGKGGVQNCGESYIFKEQYVTHQKCAAGVSRGLQVYVSTLELIFNSQLTLVSIRKDFTKSAGENA